MKRLLITAVAILCASVVPAAAQTSNTRFEVGGQVSTLRLSTYKDTNPGFGGRFGYEASRRVTLEGEFNFTPHDDFKILGTDAGASVSYARRRSEALFGPKIGVRGQKIGLFGRVRPGFTRLTHRGVGCTGEVCALMLLALPEYRTEFALDYGGTLEYYPSARTIARLDLGSTLIRHRSFAPPCSTGCTTQNMTSRVSVGWRF